MPTSGCYLNYKRKCILTIISKLRGTGLLAVRVEDAATVRADIARVHLADDQTQETSGFLVHADTLAGVQFLVVTVPEDGEVTVKQNSQVALIFWEPIDFVNTLYCVKMAHELDAVVAENLD